MNMLGKVFIILVFVLSIIFMSFAATVYSTHKNWRLLVEGPTGLKAQLTQAQAKIDQLTTEHNRKVEQLEADRLAAEQQTRKLEAERDNLVTERTTLTKDNEGLRVQERER